MKQSIAFVTVMTYLTVFSGCASLVSGKKADLEVRSMPAGASVEIDGMQIGKTPLTTEVKRKKRHEVKIVKEGYQEEIRMTKRGFNWWFAGNILFGGIIGIIIDFATGAVYSVKPDEIDVQLKQA